METHRVMKLLIRKIYNRLNRYLGKVRKLISPKLICKKVGSYKSTIEARVIIATKNGLYFLDKNLIIKVLEGEFYGVTYKADTIYVFEKTNKKGRIIYFHKNIYNEKYNVLVDKLSPGCHQIDFIGDDLYVTDTYNNRILIFDIDGNFKNDFYPLGILENGRKSSNYGHINSVYSYNGFIYLLCHNETKKTGKNSEILKLNKQNDLIGKINLNASSAHNCAIYNNKFLVCDSLNNKVILDNNVLIDTDDFTRGLSIFDDFILIGGSDYKKRSQRIDAKGTVYILNNDFNLLEKIRIPGMVQEIRSLSDNDLSLSNTQ
jgi:hypothetical protein